MKEKNLKSELKCEFLSEIPKEQWIYVPQEFLIDQIIRYELFVEHLIAALDIANEVYGTHLKRKSHGYFG